MKLVVRCIIGALIGTAIAVAYALVDAMLSGTSATAVLSSPVFWVVTGVCAAITGLIVMDKGDDTPRAVKSVDRIAGEQLVWAIGAVIVICLLIGLVTQTSVLDVLTSPAFWIPAAFAILAAGLEPYRKQNKEHENGQREDEPQ